jgi:peptidoglycan/LPS O-acetylase OafA/YrhL
MASANPYDHHNNIGLIRLLLAVAVIGSHSYQLCLGPSASDPLAVLTSGQESGGSLAVNLFFLLSGYLITKSWLMSSSATAYLRKRILRIYPGFLVAIVVSAIIAAASSPNALAYFRGLLGRNDSLLRTALLLHNPNECLDHSAAFVGNPYPDAVNHSLWTLQPELFCYLLLAGMGAVGGLGNRRWMVAVCLVAHVGFAVNLLRLGTADMTLWRFVAYFSAGAVFHLYRQGERIKSPPVCALRRGFRPKNQGLELLPCVCGQCSL